MSKGQIRKAISGFYYIYSEGETYQTRGRGLLRKENITPLVGDKVLFESTTKKDGVLTEVLPRENQLPRPPVANVDLAVLVISAVEPAFSTQLLDRYLTVLESLHIQALIYVTKTDLVSPLEFDELKNIQRIYQEIGYLFLLPDPLDKEASFEELKALFPDKLIVFMGQSGAGKSTLMNRLAPHLALETAPISTSLGRGKHTTRHVELFPLEGGLVADTPGFSSFDFQMIDKEEMPTLFPEFAAVSQKCQYRGCMHRHEPRCAVKDGVASGEIESFRYDHYLLFLDEIEQRKPMYNQKKK